MLQMEPQFATTIGPVGGALELRWQSALRQVEQEMQRCRNTQDVRVRWDLITFSIVNEGSTASYYYRLEELFFFKLAVHRQPVTP